MPNATAFARNFRDIKLPDVYYLSQLRCYFSSLVKLFLIKLWAPTFAVWVPLSRNNTIRDLQRGTILIDLYCLLYTVVSTIKASQYHISNLSPLTDGSIVVCVRDNERHKLIRYIKGGKVFGATLDVEPSGMTHVMFNGTHCIAVSYA